MDERVMEVNELGELIWPVLMQHSAVVQGAFLTQLIAMFLSSFQVPDDKVKTAELRIGILDSLLTNARAQVAVIEAERGQGCASG